MLVEITNSFSSNWKKVIIHKSATCPTNVFTAIPTTVVAKAYQKNIAVGAGYSSLVMSFAQIKE